MYRGSRYFGSFSTLSWWWCSLRIRWFTLDKGPWVVILIAMLFLSGFGYTLHSIYTYRNDQHNLNCLALNVYFEARGEPLDGQYAVAEVTMNRVASGRYPSTVCGVVYQKGWDPLRKRQVGAFSWTEYESPPSPVDR